MEPFFLSRLKQFLDNVPPGRWDEAIPIIEDYLYLAGVPLPASTLLNAYFLLPDWEELLLCLVENQGKTGEEISACLSERYIEAYYRSTLKRNRAHRPPVPACPPAESPGLSLGVLKQAAVFTVALTFFLMPLSIGADAVQGRSPLFGQLLSAHVEFADIQKTGNWTRGVQNFLAHHGDFSSLGFLDNPDTSLLCQKRMKTWALAGLSTDDALIEVLAYQEYVHQPGRPRLNQLPCQDDFHHNPSPEELAIWVRDASRIFGVPNKLLLGLLKTESLCRQYKTSGQPLISIAGAVGMAQVIPSQHPECDRLRLLSDTRYSIFSAAHILNRMFHLTGSWPRALRLYNTGDKPEWASSGRRFLQKMWVNSGYWDELAPAKLK